MKEEMQIQEEISRLVLGCKNEGFVYANASQPIKDFVLWCSMQKNYLTLGDGVCWFAESHQSFESEYLIEFLKREYKKMKSSGGGNS